MIVDTCEAIKEIGYNDPDRRFNAAGVSVLNLFSRQAAGHCLWCGQWERPWCRRATSSARTQVNHGSVSEKSWQMNKTMDKWADESLTQPKETSMLWTIIVILVVLWLLGFIGHFGGGLIHLLLVIAVVVLIINLIQGRRGL